MRDSIWLEKFDPTWDFAVNKPLRFGSEDFEIGEIFNAKTSERQLRTLYENRFIVRAVGPPVTHSVKVEAVDAEAVAEHLEENADQLKETVAKAKAGTLRLEKRSGGWYDVIGPDGKKLNDKALRIEAAGRLLKKASRDLDV